MTPDSDNDSKVAPHLLRGKVQATALVGTIWQPVYPHGQQFVYLQVLERGGGLTIGININPDKNCNFSCIYCEVDRTSTPGVIDLDVEALARELHETLSFIASKRLRELPMCRSLPEQLLRLRHVALSGEGEPTLSPKFADALRAVVHVRAGGEYGFFKLVLCTNATGLDLPKVQSALRLLVESDEVWAKLDGGTRDYVNRINRAEVPLSKILGNILTLGRQRQIVIQTLFPAIGGQEPCLNEIEQYCQRLLELKELGTGITLVQILSANPIPADPNVDHLPLRVLSKIAARVRLATGLRVEVF